MSECGILNSGIKNKHLAIKNKDPPVPTRRILHTMVLLKHYLQQGSRNPKYTMYSQDLSD